MRDCGLDLCEAVEQDPQAVTAVERRVGHEAVQVFSVLLKLHQPGYHCIGRLEVALGNLLTRLNEVGCKREDKVSRREQRGAIKVSRPNSQIKANFTHVEARKYVPHTARVSSAVQGSVSNTSGPATFAWYSCSLYTMLQQRNM